MGEEDTREALKYGAIQTLLLSKKLDKKIIKELTVMAKNIGSKIEIISIETSEGEQFYNLSGIGAILRFKI